MLVSDAVATRRSIRSFSDRPVALEVLRRVLEKAQFAPSGCNFQPWRAKVLTNAPLRRLQEKMSSSAPQEPVEYDFSRPQASPVHMERQRSIGAAMYGAAAVRRDDAERRTQFVNDNLVSFGARALLICYFERFMDPPQWADVGMWLQTVMLLLREEGLDSCAQESLSFHARLIKQELGICDRSHILFCGLAIGYRNEDAPVNNFTRPRAPLDEVVEFAGFEQ
ncbi:MAG: nitroreductase [Rhizobiaceae bacterium]|nr:MAG: nitroreductase [Rhizobiaceae bacterium]